MTHSSIWAIGDLHLSFGVPQKEMDVFGPEWRNHADKIKDAWDHKVDSDDIVLIPGDISWAMRLEDALPDLEWIDKRPGRKILIKGNHDFWWGSVSKARAALPPTIRVLQNDAIDINGFAIAGARLWDTQEFRFDSIIEMKPSIAPPKVKEEGKDEELFRRELGRLEVSLQQLPKDAPIKIAMTHYPPIGLDLAPTSASALLERYGVTLAVFGHLHSFKQGLPSLFGSARGIRYVLSSCDYLNFSPICVVRNGVVVSEIRR
jgi:uncharacterized protein